MKHFFLFFFIAICLGNFAGVQAQSGPPGSESKPVDIIRAGTLRTAKIDSVKEVQTGKRDINEQIQAKQGTTLFECDSFYYDKSTKTFEAFGRVHINDNDSVNIYSDYLLYHVDTRIANLRKNVRLTDGKSNLTTNTLDYDLNQKIGNYYNGGKVETEKSVLTSTEATYYADSKDVYFKKKVVLNDPQYKLRADSLLYNSQTQLTTFITQTFIEDSARNIVTSSGFYDIKNKKAYFGRRPTINDGASQVIADNIDTNDSTGISILTGQVTYKDTAQGFAMRGDFMRVNNKEGSLLATKNAVLIIKQDQDSLFVTGDTLISGKLINLPAAQVAMRIDTALKLNDTIRLKKDSGAIVLAKPNTDTTVAVKQPATFDAMAVDRKISDSSLTLSEQKPAPAKPAPGKPPAVMKKAAPGKPGQMPKPDLAGPPSKDKNAKLPAASKQPVPKNNTTKDSSEVLTDVTVVDTKAETDTTLRYFQAFHNVRIFSDSLQAVGDSLFYSGKDSIFKLFTEPVMWANSSQVSGDTIYIFTKNKKADRVYVFENGIAINETGRNMYNQLKGIRMNGYFRDGAIDYMRAKGNAESIYYARDKENYLVGINRVSGDIIDLRFKDKELNRVVVMNEVKGTMYPVTQMPDGEKRLRNFKWQEDRRPKTKFELFEPPKPRVKPEDEKKEKTDDIKSDTTTNTVRNNL